MCIIVCIIIVMYSCIKTPLYITSALLVSYIATGYYFNPSRDLIINEQLAKQLMYEEPLATLMIARYHPYMVTYVYFDKVFWQKIIDTIHCIIDSNKDLSDMYLISRASEAQLVVDGKPTSKEFLQDLSNSL